MATGNSLSLLHLSSRIRSSPPPLLLNTAYPTTPTSYSHPPPKLSLRLVPASATEGGSTKSGSADGNDEDLSVPSWAQPGTDELPPWARQEAQRDSQGLAVPFYVYLLASTIAAIAAVGSIFEYVNQRPVFGVLNSDSVFYAPLLGFFVFIGFPSSAFLWFKSVQVANKEADEQDRRDGYL